MLDDQAEVFGNKVRRLPNRLVQRVAIREWLSETRTVQIFRVSGGHFPAPEWCCEGPKLSVTKPAVGTSIPQPRLAAIYRQHSRTHGQAENRTDHVRGFRHRPPLSFGQAKYPLYRKQRKKNAIRSGILRPFAGFERSE